MDYYGIDSKIFSLAKIEAPQDYIGTVEPYLEEIGTRFSYRRGSEFHAAVFFLSKGRSKKGPLWGE